LRAANALRYLQPSKGQRPDVIAVSVELLKPRSYVRATITQRPVYVLGEPKEKDLASRFDQIRMGLARRLVAKGAGGDEWAVLRQQFDLFKEMHSPIRTYPATSCESVINERSGLMAGDHRYTLEDTGSVPEASTWYRTANAGPYKTRDFCCCRGGLVAPRLLKCGSGTYA
jgi:hypothetical protein